MTSLDFVKELVNAFNVSNYGSKVNTNFVVEGDNIVVKFNCDQGSAKRYLSQMARDLVREYYSDESVARYAFDLGSLPFNFDKGKWTRSKAGTQLTVPIDNGVIFNLKVHFAEEFEIDVRNQVIKAIDEKHHLGKKHIEEILIASIEQVEIDPLSGYIKCLLFNQPNVQTYFVKVLQEQIKKHYYTCSGFYDIDDNKVYFKDVENIGFVRSVTELYKERSGYNFNFPSDSGLKVRSYKNAMSLLIFSLTGLPICGYYYDEFVDKGRISSGDRFAFIPMVKEGNSSRYLSYMEADKINAKFSHDILTNVRGQTKGTESDEFGEVYALSDRQIALLIPVIIENSVINKDGQIEIDPELYEKLQTPSTRLGSPRHESGVLPNVRHNVGAAEVVAAKNVQAGSSAWSQPMDHCSSPAPSVRLWSLPQSGPSSWKGANESMRTEKSIWYVPSSCSPGVEDVNDVEPKKQQVSDECSEAKSQDSKSLKKHRGSVQKIKKLLSSTFKKQYGVNLKRHDVGRDTTRSTSETPVTEKPLLSKRSASERKAKSNPPSGVTSPTHEGGSEWQQRLNPDQREELRPFLSPELRKKLDSNSLSPEDEQLKHLLYTPSGQEKMKKNFESQEENLRRSVNAQLPSSDNLSSKKVNRDSGFSSMGSASPAVPHKESVSSKLKECDLQQAKYMSKALGKN